MRTKVEWRSSSKINYKDFCKKHPTLSIPFYEWKKLIYTYNEWFREYILETGERVKLPAGLGDFSITKKKRKKVVVIDGVEKINLPIDWKKTQEKGKKIYNFNYHTDGYFFGWKWFRRTARFRLPLLWIFKPYKTTSRLLRHYLTVDDHYQHIYQEWGNTEL